jgi:hypothetical protein
MPVRIVLLPGVALLPLLIVIMPTMSSVVSGHTASFIIVAVSPALIIPTHVLIEEVIREGLLISYVLNFPLCDVALAILTEPIAWSGPLCVLAMRVAVLIPALRRVVSTLYQVDAGQEIWLAPSKVSKLHHVDGGKGVCVDLHGVLVKN